MFTSETELATVGLLGTEVFPRPPFLVGNRLRPPWPSLSSKEQIWTVVNPGRDKVDAESREEQSRNNSAALKQGPGFFSRDIHNNVFKLFIELKLYFSFVDYAKAFDCVDHNKLWTILQEMGIPDHLTCLLRNLYAGQEATVRTGHGTTDWFQIGKGVFFFFSYAPIKSCPFIKYPQSSKHCTKC